MTVHVGVRAVVVVQLTSVFEPGGFLAGDHVVHGFGLLCRNGNDWEMDLGARVDV